MEGKTTSMALNLAKVYGLLQAAALLLKEVEKDDPVIEVLDKMVVTACVELETFYVASFGGHTE